MGASELQRYRLSVAEYERMAEHGVLEPDVKLELIDGEMIVRAPQGTRRAGTVWRLNRMFFDAAGSSAIVAVRGPVRLGDYSEPEPEPDLMLLRPREDFYATAHPVPADLLLLVEVSDSSARQDRTIKVPLYARHGIAEVWIVDLDANVLRFFRQPVAGVYTDITATDTPGLTAPLALPGAAVDLSLLLR